MTPKVTHTPPRKVCVASILPGKEAPASCPERGLCETHVRAKETDENEKDETDKKCVWLPMKKNLVKRDNCNKPGPPEPCCK